MLYNIENKRGFVNPLIHYHVSISNVLVHIGKNVLAALRKS